MRRGTVGVASSCSNWSSWGGLYLESHWFMLSGGFYVVKEEGVDAGILYGLIVQFIVL